MIASSRLRAMTRTVPGFCLILAVFGGILSGAGALSAAEEDAGTVAGELLVMGPLPSPPPADMALLHGTVHLVPEIDLAGHFPTVGQQASPAAGRSLTWQAAASGPGGEVTLTEPGVYWLAVQLRLDRWTNLTLHLAGASTMALFLDGEEQASREAAATGSADEEAEDEPLSATLAAGRGTHTIMARVVVTVEEAPPLGVRLSAAVDPAAATAWGLDNRTELATFRRELEIARIGNLTVAPGGKSYACRVTRRDPDGEGRRSSVEVFDRKGGILASFLGGDAARPLVFSPDWKELLLARDREEGSDLLIWTAPVGHVRTILRDEPGLGLVRFSPDGRFLLLSSTRGTEEEETEAEAAQRRLHLREKVTDYTPLPHLHLLEIATGLRRRLTEPGDIILDDAIFLPSGDVLYGRTVTREERPWFASEIRIIDLPEGHDRLVATFTSGWEVRPRGFAVDPAGRRLVFLGPPDQVGEGRPERNVYNTQLWLLNLQNGEFSRLTTDLPYTFLADNGLPGWDKQGKVLYAKVADGSWPKLARLEPDESGGWAVAELYPEAAVGAAAMSADGAAVLYTLSTPTAPSHLEARELPRGKPRVFLEPNRELQSRWRLAALPQDVSFTGPGGETIEAWWYTPPVAVDEGEIPLILYYYGGCSPTVQGFNFTHQWLAANGYGVLVMNPRGAFGYGDVFADHHVGDWGPKATADILAGVDHFLAGHPEVDGERIGIYGGSYGGFMTEYLISATDRFAAAVAMYGVSDLGTYWGQGVWGWTYGDMSVGGEMPWGATELFVENSPLFRADNIMTPLLLLHGLADANVTPGESEQLFTALAVQNKPVELVLFPDEDHGISGTFANREAHRTMMLEWFDRYLRDQPEAWEARWE